MDEEYIVESGRFLHESDAVTQMVPVSCRMRRGLPVEVLGDVARAT